HEVALPEGQAGIRDVSALCRFQIDLRCVFISAALMDISVSRPRRDPMPRLDRLSRSPPTNLLPFPAQATETAPFVRLTKPLAACRLAIVTTAGLHRRGDRL